VIDIVGASTGLLLLLPLFVLVAVLVALDSPGPVLHRRRVLARQEWDGGAGEPPAFDAFKFRTMRADADEYLANNPHLWAAFQKDFKLARDPRVTRLGRFLRRTSIDELPQLWNVLAGQMSLVGPRMITPAELSRYAGHEAELLSVTPGLTGLWQVSGRTNTGYEERVRLDVTYIYGRSMMLDVEVLFRTVRCVLAGRGAV
jgi:lipopolysaccharide/colanic/teichoic acid biosynthesis glycosyltransferase